MKRFLLALVLSLLPSLAAAQCNGVFPANTLCGNATGASALPKPTSNSVLTGVPGGSSGQVQFNNSGVFGGLTNTQLTALVNSFTSGLSGSVPASGGGTTSFLRADGTFALIPSGAPIAAFDTICNPTAGSAVPIACQLGFLHLKDFSPSVVGDNSADDTTALQNWLNACATNRLICYLDPPSVCYKITAALTVTSANGITIMGPGRDKVGNGICLSSTTQNGLVVTTLGQINLYGFQITGQATATAGDMFKLNSGSSNPNQRSTMRDMYFQGGFNQVHYVTASGWTIDNGLFNGPNTSGISVFIEDNTATDAGDQFIHDSTFSGNATGTAIVQTSAGGLKVVGNKIINYANGYLLSLSSGVSTSDLFFSANSMEAFTSSGISLNKASGTVFGTVVITGNEINGCASCFNTDTNAGWLSNVIISSNHLSPNASGTCMDIGTGSGVQVIGNNCQGGGANGIGIITRANLINGLVSNNIFNSNIVTNYTNTSTTTVIIDNVGLAFAALPATAQNGSQIFVTNGAPASSPCTGASTGSMAFRQNSAWKCF